MQDDLFFLHLFRRSLRMPADFSFYQFKAYPQRHLKPITFCEFFASEDKGFVNTPLIFAIYSLISVIIQKLFIFSLNFIHTHPLRYCPSVPRSRVNAQERCRRRKPIDRLI